MRTIEIPEDLFRRMFVALATASSVFETQRFGGLDQNPKGVRDLVGVAAFAAKREADRQTVIEQVRTYGPIGPTALLSRVIGSGMLEEDAKAAIQTALESGRIELNEKAGYRMPEIRVPRMSREEEDFHRSIGTIVDDPKPTYRRKKNLPDGAIFGGGGGEVTYDPRAMSDADRKLLRAIGINQLDKKPFVYAPIIETVRNNRLYIKFMSDGGKRDDEQGRAFKKFLEKHGIAFRQGSSPRHFTWVDRPALEKALDVTLT